MTDEKMNSRQDRAERRRQLAMEARERAVRLSRPSPLPPHPEGLAPRLWPVLAATASLALAFWSWLAAVMVFGLVLAYAIATRNDRKSQLLWTYIQGRQQFAAGEYEAALANFEDLEEAEFMPPAVLRGIGLSCYELGKWAEAATYLEDVPDRSADETMALAHSLVELDEAAQGASLLDGLDALSPFGRVIRGVADLRLGKPASAAERLEGLLAEAGGKDAPGAEPYLAARYWLGLARQEAGDETGSREVLKELFALDPAYHDVAERLGRSGPS